MEEAAGFKELRDRFGLSQDEIAARVGKSRSAVANTLRLFNLPAEIQEDLYGGRLTQGHARPLLAVEDQGALLRLRQCILERGPSVREVEGWVTAWKQTGEFPQEAGAGMTGGPSARKPGAAPDKDLLAMQAALTKALGLPVRISGAPGKGRLSVSFSSPEELAAITARLGLK